MKLIKECLSIIKADFYLRDPTKKQEIFYNPLMESNRNISILLLNSISNRKMNIALPLAGSGIRGLRFLNELQKGKMNHLFVNDKKDNFLKVFNENLTLNKINSKNLSFFNEEATLFLLNQVNNKDKPSKFCGFFDYIDLDPFGSPNPFLSAAVARICRKGILAITATDTAALTGTYPKVTRRKYDARSLKNYMMHETGLRILIRKVQLVGMQYDKALIPVLSYYKEHYFRVYFRSERGKEKCDELIKQHQFLLWCRKCLSYKSSRFNHEKCSCGDEFEFCGPLWVGKLFEKKLVTKMAKDNTFPADQKFLDLLKEEKEVVGFHDLHALSKKEGTDTPLMEKELKRMKGTRTHFSKHGVKVLP